MTKRTDFIPCFTNVLKEIPKGEKLIITDISKLNPSP